MFDEVFDYYYSWNSGKRPPKASSLGGCLQEVVSYIRADTVLGHNFASLSYGNCRDLSPGMFCRLQVAGWNLIITGKPLAHKRNVQTVDLPWLLHHADYDRSISLLPPKCQTGRSDERKVYSYDFKPAMNYWFWKSIWNVIWNSCWIWFLPCEYQNESTVPWVGVCGPLPKTLTLFMTKICDIPYPIYDLTLKSKPSSDQWHKHNLWRAFVDFLFDNDEKVASS